MVPCIIYVRYLWVVKEMKIKVKVKEKKFFKSRLLPMGNIHPCSKVISINVKDKCLNITFNLSLKRWERICPISWQESKGKSEIILLLNYYKILLNYILVCGILSFFDDLIISLSFWYTRVWGLCVSRLLRGW